MEQEMKCICGYEIIKEWGEEPTIGDEEFIPIYNKIGFTAPNPKKFEPGDYNYSFNAEVYLYACPKCNTIKMVYDE